MPETDSCLRREACEGVCHSKDLLLDLLWDQLVAAQLGGSSSLPLMHGSGVRFSFL